MRRNHTDTELLHSAFCCRPDLRAKSRRPASGLVKVGRILRSLGTLRFFWPVGLGKNLRRELQFDMMHSNLLHDFVTQLVCKLSGALHVGRRPSLFHLRFHQVLVKLPCALQILARTCFTLDNSSHRSFISPSFTPLVANIHSMKLGVFF